MADEKYAISRLNDNPPRRIPWYPVDGSKEYMLNYCQCVNEGHAKAGTGSVFKVFKLE